MVLILLITTIHEASRVNVQSQVTIGSLSENRIKMESP